MDIKDQIAVMQHYANGGKVEYTASGGHWNAGHWNAGKDSWHLMNGSGNFNFQHYDYRIKKEPRKFKIWITTKGETCHYSSGDNITQLKNVGWELITVTEDV